MKKHIGLICVISAITMLASCNSKTVLQEATGATNKQISVVEKILSDSNITYEKVSVSVNPLVEDMDSDWKAYDLTDSSGETYLLILRKADNDFTAVLDSNGQLISGLIDNVTTPTLCALHNNGDSESDKKQAISPQEFVQELADSITFDSQAGNLSFTIPNEIPDEYSIYIHISGRCKMGDGSMSFHAFEEESENNSWKLGETYTYDIGKDTLLEGIVDVGLIQNDNKELQYNKLVTIDENGTTSFE